MSASETEILITTSDDVPNRRITSVLGLVRGNSVRARRVGRDIQVGIRTIVGCRAGVKAEPLQQSREEALADIVAQARSKGPG